MTSLNIGAGEDESGDVKFDIVRSKDPDVQGTATHLPFNDGLFDTIIMDQVLEHIPPDDLELVLEEIYRVLEDGGILKARVPHAGTRLSDQDPTHRSTWTYETPSYFSNGNFSWYFDQASFDFELQNREVLVWSHEEVRFSSLRSVALQKLHGLFGKKDSLLYWPTVAGSLKFELKKI